MAYFGRKSTASVLVAGFTHVCSYPKLCSSFFVSSLPCQLYRLRARVSIFLLVHWRCCIAGGLSRHGYTGGINRGCWTPALSAQLARRALEKRAHNNGRCTSYVGVTKWSRITHSSSEPLPLSLCVASDVLYKGLECAPYSCGMYVYYGLGRYLDLQRM